MSIQNCRDFYSLIMALVAVGKDAINAEHTAELDRRDSTDSNFEGNRSLKLWLVNITIGESYMKSDRRITMK